MAQLLIGMLVLGRIAAACWANVLQKQLANDPRPLGTAPTALELLGAIWLVTSLILSPWWISALVQTVSASLLQVDSPDEPVNWFAFWGWMLLACLLEVPGNFLLLRSIQRTDLSIFGPLSSYKPIIGMLLGWWFLAEVPTLAGVIGTIVVLAGSLMLADRSTSRFALQTTDPAAEGKASAWSGVQDRLIAVALTASGSVFFKQAMVNRSALLSLASWSAVSCGLALVWMILQRGSFRRLIRLACNKSLLAVAVCMLVMQGFTTIVFQAMHIGYALALFQLGSLVSVYLGHRLFGEAEFWRRMIAASIMFAGAVVIMLGG